MSKAKGIESRSRDSGSSWREAGREQAWQHLALVSCRDPRPGYGPEILPPQCYSGNRGRALMDTGYVAEVLR